MDQPSIELGEITRSDQLRHPFSLSCAECDAGMDVETPEQAVFEGWSSIYEVDVPSWNYLGVCPDCRVTAHPRIVRTIKKRAQIIPNPITRSPQLER